MPWFYPDNASIRNLLWHFKILFHLKHETELIKSHRAACRLANQHERRRKKTEQLE